MDTTDMDMLMLTMATNMPTSMGTNMVMDTADTSDTMATIAKFVRDMSVLAFPASPLHSYMRLW